MPGQVIRVYPASGANAMLPLTPRNGYNPTLLFCGGQVIDDYGWGDYGYPNVDTWTVAASRDCHRITPEPTDGSSPNYVQDDNLPVGRTMGQFVGLPDGTLLLLNGAQYGTAGYANQTGTTLTLGQMPYGPSLAAGPVLQPVIYNPNAPAGSRFSSAGLGNSTVPRLYHSTALLLPDGSVMVAGSNPNADVNTTTTYTRQLTLPSTSIPPTLARRRVLHRRMFRPPCRTVVIPSTSRSRLRHTRAMRMTRREIRRYG
jgi:hypothetical protein